MDRFAPLHSRSPPGSRAPSMQETSLQTPPMWTRGFSPSWSENFPSVNLGRPLQRVLQFLQRKVLAARNLEDWRLAAGAEFTGVGNLCRDIVRDHDRAVAVGMDQIVRFHGHAGHAHLAA